MMVLWGREANFKGDVTGAMAALHKADRDTDKINRKTGRGVVNTRMATYQRGGA